MLQTSSRLKGDYQPYPSPPFGNSYEYAGNHLRGQFRCIANAGPQRNLSKVVLVFYIYLRFFFMLLWGAAMKHYEESHY